MSGSGNLPLEHDLQALTDYLNKAGQGPDVLGEAGDRVKEVTTVAVCKNMTSQYHLDPGTSHFDVGTGNSRQPMPGSRAWVPTPKGNNQFMPLRCVSNFSNPGPEVDPYISAMGSIETLHPKAKPASPVVIPAWIDLKSSKSAASATS